MIYFYWACFAALLVSLITIALDITKPSKSDALIFRVSMLLVVLSEIIKTL